MTIISTNLGNTIESARRTRFDPAPGNSATNVQDAIAGFGSGFLPDVPTTPPFTASGSIPVTTIVAQTDQSAPITLTVPDAASWAANNSKWGIPLSIFDISGAASTNNVTINFTGADTASGLSSLTIATDYGGVLLEPKSGGWVVVN